MFGAEKFLRGLLRDKEGDVKSAGGSVLPNLNDGELVVFVPEFQYPRGFRVDFESGNWVFNTEEQEIRVEYKGSSSNQILRILPK